MEYLRAETQTTLVTSRIIKEKPLRWTVENIFTLGRVSREARRLQAENEEELLVFAENMIGEFIRPGMFTKYLRRLGRVESQLTPWARLLLDDATQVIESEVPSKSLVIREE